MRNTSDWRERQKFIQKLKEYRANLTTVSPVIFCDIELGLYVLSQLVPEAPAHALWVLLTGYPFSVLSRNWSPEQHRMLGNARHILTQFRSQYNWRRYLEQYRLLDEFLRGYDIDGNLENFTRRDVSFCHDREGVYRSALQEPLPYSKTSVKWVENPGIYECVDRGYRHCVDIRGDFIFSRPVGHNLEGKTERHAIEVSWEALLETARWMDTQVDQDWEKRLNKVRVEIFINNTLTPVNTLTLEGLMHIIGMVSSGKSTLMDILAVWATSQGYHVTIVVGDVISALNRAKLFTQLNIPVAPILGASNRQRHTNRLHRACHAEKPLESLNQQHPGFRWLSSACPLSELRRDVAQPFEMGRQPCLNLCAIVHKNSEDEETKENLLPVGKKNHNAEDTPNPDQQKKFACPLYSVCPLHQAQRDLIDAKIWIATPASLVYTRVAPQLNPEQIRFGELVYRHSDLVIVDEADQVQVQLDNLFSPNQTLVSRGKDAFLSQLWERVVQQLNQGGRGQVRKPDIKRWCQFHDIAQTVTNQIYSLLLKQDSALHEWSKKGDYFTDWLIFEKVAIALSGAPTDTYNDHSDYRRLRQLFDHYIDNPLGERGNNPLSELTRKLIMITNEELVEEHLKEWIDQNKEPTVILTEEKLRDTAKKLHFALLVAVLQNQLNQILLDWKRVEIELKLENQSSLLFHTPPRDYEAVIPASAMGNLLALQYVPSTEGGAGELRFFKCMGVGRWLLLHLHELFASDGIIGPHVLLLSGTSWAGKAPGYHLQIPVSGVLHSPHQELQAIENSYFEFSPFYNEEGQPITISGAKGLSRDLALKTLLNQLAKPGNLSPLSILENERNDLPENRQRILLIVGSYAQAKLAHEHLKNLRPEWQEQILHLVSDDEEFSSEWGRSDGSLQRGLVYQFANKGAWLLIAPLMAIERGHNILNDEDKAAIGAAYFLVRPHPRPDDINYAIHSMNRWAIDHYANSEWFTNHCEENLLTLDRVGNIFRNEAYRRWHYLLRLPMIYSTLPNKPPYYERDAVTWNQLVSIWQVIGRLVRGGSPARVFFCDAAFARRTAFSDEEMDRASTSLLVSIKQVLRPYFTQDSDPPITNRDRELVQALYGPFYTALEQMGGIYDE